LKYAIKSVQEEKFQDGEPFVDSTVVLVNSEASAEMISARSQAPSSKHKKARAERPRAFSVGAASVAREQVLLRTYGVGCGATTP
jgi:hypothetical protein